MVLALELALDVPVVGLPFQHSEVVTQAGFAGAKNPIDGSLLGRRRDVVLHFLNDAGVLFNADLSRARAAYWIGH